MHDAPLSPARLDRYFPRYTDFEPRVPVWCVTPATEGCIHRFFDTSPISPSGRYLAVFQLPFETRQPAPGERGFIRLVDLHTGQERQLAETAGWEPQMGANLNWGKTDHQLFFNDVDTETWQPFAWKLDPLTGKRQRLGGTVYHASPDGCWLISANLRTMRKTQPGYGVVLPPTELGWNVGLAADDGFCLTDTASGECRLLVSLRDLVTQAVPPIDLADPDAVELYGFHSKFSPQGDRLMLSLRWYPRQPRDHWNMFEADHGAVRFAWVTMRLDGSELHCAVGPDQWEKGGHHATWFPDGEHISMNLRIDRQEMRLVQVNADGTDLRTMHDQVIGSGHPTVCRDGRHVLTDTYTFESFTYGDGTIPLRWIDLETGREEAVIRINTQQPCKDGVLRVDPHPAWGRQGRWVTFNAFVGGTRRVYIADFGDLCSRTS